MSKTYRCYFSLKRSIQKDSFSRQTLNDLYEFCDIYAPEAICAGTDDIYRQQLLLMMILCSSTTNNSPN